MASPICTERVAKLPFGFCTDAYCDYVNNGTGAHCKAVGLDPDDPVGPLFDENLYGPGKGGYCYCCCSCFGSYTPIEVSPGEYALARDLVEREKILAAGPDLRWAPSVVERVSTWESTEGLVSSMYFLRYTWDDEVREVIVSPDHLFLVEDGTLVAVQDLAKAPLRLRRADGGLSAVVVLARGTYQGGVTSIQMAGDFDGTDLTGHLLNTNGVVTADYKVQVSYASLHLAAGLVKEFSPDRESLPGGTPEYHEAFPDEAYARFVDDPASWPPGFTPTVRAEAAARIPATAARYLTDAQARDLRRRAPRGSEGNTFPARSLLYLFNLMRGLYPKVDFVLDWDNPLPNAYSWQEWGRQTVVVTGGLVRLDDLDRDGLSLIVSAMVAYQSTDVRCVGEADYAGISLVMRILWADNLYVTVVEPALEQVEKIFSYISPEQARHDPANPCLRPSTACRLQCYRAGLSMFPIPECALPKPEFFEVKDAQASGQASVRITFNRTLDAPTAETTGNYVFEPATEVSSAKVNPVQPAQVLLEVSDLAPKTSYLVRISDVVSNDDVPLNPRHSTAAFMTK